MKTIKIALAGLGNVGAGVGQLLEQNKNLITERTGASLEIIAVSARNKGKDRGFDLSNVTWCDHPLDLIDTRPDIICELMGGEDGIAHDLVKAALEHNIPVVTANKALLAKHGMTLARCAEDHKTPLAFEAAVAGGIPIIKMLREGLAANKIQKLYGILNGTCNYILTTMQQTGRDFAVILKEAQDLGYAESDPTFDVDGFDTAHKLSLLTALAFGVQPDAVNMSVSGIRPIKTDDILTADELGYRIKLIGQSLISDTGEILQIVEPSLVPKTSSLAHVSGVLNAIYTEAAPVGSTFIEGRGAGAGPTASAVVSDIIDIVMGRITAPFVKSCATIKPLKPLPLSSHIGSYYVRLMVKDEPGVIADIASILRDQSISIESLIQRGRDPNHPVMVVLTTHECARDKMLKAIKSINDVKTVAEPAFFMPILCV